MRIFTASILIIVFSILTLPNAMALGTSVTVTSPPQVPLGDYGNVDFEATVHVTVTTMPQNTMKSVSSGDFELLVVAIGFTKEVSNPSSIPPLSVHGSASSDPDQCIPSSLTGIQSGYAVCFTLPVCPFATCSMTEEMKFHLSLSGAQTHKYGFRVIAYMILQTPQVGNQLGSPVGGPQGSSWNTADFYVEVTTWT